MEYAGSFAENKDVASRLRKEYVEKALAEGETVRLDFSGVELATQSFIHALIANLIRTRGPRVLDDVSFEKCNALLKSLIRVVAEYSQEEAEIPGKAGEVVKHEGRRRKRRG